MRIKRWTHKAIGLIAAAWSMAAAASDVPPCGDEGVWIQILGSGGPELDDGRGAASYVVWLDNRARLLVDTAPGASVAFDKIGARFADLDAIALTHLLADQSAALPAFIQGSRLLARNRPLTVLGPAGDGVFPDTKTFVNRLIGPEGAFAHLADALSRKPDTGYRLRVWNVPGKGRKRWVGFGSNHLSLSAIPVHHGEVPTLAWRVEMAERSIVFASGFSNQKDVIASFAKDVDALVVPHAVPETARPKAREHFATPSKLGRVAARANARMLILGHRTNRTRGRETQSVTAIEQAYKGPVIFADDLECWGL